jgi:DNA-binding LacI/PurR family transcriptional regulator
VSARHVADLAGVSRAAVSRTFTPGASVSAKTRAKVMAAADSLGYQVNRLARGLIRSETGLVALIVAEINTPHRSDLLAALTDRLQQAGKVALVINTDRADGNVERALEQAVAYRTDAAVVLSGMPPRSLAETCLRNGMRLVLINRNEERPGSLLIRLDDAAAGRQAFVSLRAAGCRRLAIAASRAGTPSLTAREAGFRAAAREEGVEILAAALGTTAYQTGVDLGTQLLGRRDRPDGIFCTTDLLACGVMDAARYRFGIAVPEALSVIGFDDIEQAGWEAYGLTTFRQPVEAMAERAVGWLTASEPQGATRDTDALSARMIWRGSVRRI